MGKSQVKTRLNNINVLIEKLLKWEYQFKQITLKSNLPKAITLSLSQSNRVRIPGFQNLLFLKLVLIR